MSLSKHTLALNLYKDEDYEIQDIKIPLGHQVKELEPFISEISDYLLQTDFQQSKFPSKYKNVDDEDDDPDRPQSLHIGQCLLDENNNDSKLPFKVTLKNKATKIENDVPCQQILTNPSSQPKITKTIVNAPPVIVKKNQLKNNKNQKIEINNQSEKMKINNQHEKIKINNQPEKIEIDNQPEKMQISNQSEKIQSTQKKQEAVQVNKITKNQKKLVFESKVNRYTKMSIGQCLLNDN